MDFVWEVDFDLNFKMKFNILVYGLRVYTVDFVDSNRYLAGPEE